MIDAWIEFVICAAAIAFAGPELSRSADVIADKTGASSTWIGVVLLATVTSLPELVTGVSAATAAQAPDIAVGDVFGSCVFNLGLIAVLDLLKRGESVYRCARLGHVLSAGFGLAMIGLCGIVLVAGASLPIPAFFHVGVYTPVLVLFYFLAMRTIFVYERGQREEHAETVAERYPGLTLRSAILRYAAAGAVVLAAGAAIPFAASHLAETMAWNDAFVGTLFVAFATSAPELAITLFALRLGAIDMAIANLFGSNLFDILILAIDDAFYLPGPILADVSQTHAVSAFTACTMSAIVIICLMARPRGRVFKTIGWASYALLALFALNTAVLFYGGA